MNIHRKPLELLLSVAKKKPTNEVVDAAGSWLDFAGKSQLQV
jgi:hypothetical protein